MQITLYAILIIMLLLVIRQDINTRTIHVALPIGIFAIAVTINHYAVHLNWVSVLSNALFILINVVGLIVYTSLKSGRMANPINKTLGIGDILFFIAICPLFQLKQFILFFILGLVFSLLVHIGQSIFKNSSTIPLAGHLALFTIINVVSHFFMSKSLLL